MSTPLDQPPVSTTLPVTLSAQTQNPVPASAPSGIWNGIKVTVAKGGSFIANCAKNAFSFIKNGAVSIYNSKITRYLAGAAAVAGTAVGSYFLANFISKKMKKEEGAIEDKSDPSIEDGEEEPVLIVDGILIEDQEKSIEDQEDSIIDEILDPANTDEKLARVYAFMDCQELRFAEADLRKKQIDGDAELARELEQPEDVETALE